jgi:hypothetical protein
LAVSRASDPFFMFGARGHVFYCTRASGLVFIFCEHGTVFGGNEGVDSRFHVLRAQNRFRRYRWRRVPISCFVHPVLFLAVSRASGPVFMFYAPGTVFVGTEGVGSRFHVLLTRTNFRLFRGRRVPFSCFTRRTRFRRYRGRPVSISCFVLPDSFSAVPWASVLVFTFCAPRLILDGTESVGSRFMFCTPGLIFGCAECVGSRFHDFRFGTHFRRYEGVGSRFQVLCARTHFRRYRGPRVLFSCFECPKPFSAVPRSSGPDFMFCAPRLIFGGVEGVGSHFHVLCARTHFRRSRFLVLRARTHF